MAREWEELEDRREERTEGDSDGALVETEGQFRSDIECCAASGSATDNTFERMSSKAGSKSRWRCFCASDTRWFPITDEAASAPLLLLGENSSLNNARLARS